MDCRRRPVGGAARKTVFGPLAAMIGRRRFAGKERAVIETSRVDDGAGAGSCFPDRADIDSAITADYELCGAGAEAIKLHQRPVVGPDVERAIWIACGPRVMRTTERAAAGAQPDF